MANLLAAILEQTDDLKKSSPNRVLHLWPSHYQHFSSFVTKLNDHNRDMLQIRDPKIMQSLIDRVPCDKAHQARAEEVSHGQLAMRTGVITEANSKAVDLAAFNTKVAIKDALSLVKESCHIADELDGRPA